VFVIHGHTGKSPEQRGTNKRIALTIAPIPITLTFPLRLTPFRIKEMKTVTPG
jgi:hypothetical protein